MSYLVTYAEYDLDDYSLILDFQPSTHHHQKFQLTKYRVNTKFGGQLAYLLSKWGGVQARLTRRGRLLRAVLTGRRRWADHAQIKNNQIKYSARFFTRVIKFDPLMLGFRPLAVTQYCCFTPRWSTLSVRQRLRTIE